MATSDLRRDFLKVLVLPALTFLLVPLLTVGFARYGAARLDGEILEAVEGQIARSQKVPEAAKPELVATYRAHPPSAACDDPDPELAGWRDAVCDTWGDVWQFRWAARLGLAAALLGLATFAAIGLLGLVAWRRPRAQYWSFMVGWRGLVAVTAVETALQGVLLVWLSYWVTALLLERYYVKLIVIAGVLAALGVGAIVMGLFRKPAPPEPLEAELLAEADAPGLWRRVRELAGRLGAAPPRAIAAGIDDNFFVTEASTPLAGGATAEGRLLYVSLPLLRTLEPREADAILAHELAHFHGGDTAASARLAPALVRYHAYWAALAEGGLTLPASLVMRLYRSVFELALAREQRRREEVADATAARLTAPDDVARALVKVTGYSSFRARTERSLFEARSVHQGSLGLRARIDDGLPAHAASQGFLEELRRQPMPHPFDTHPPLPDRIAVVGGSVRPEDAASLLQARPARTWADEVLTGAAVEERLWSAYEARFQAGHQESLAWRFLPATDEERAHVLRYFPDVEFAGKKGEVTRLGHAALVLPDGAAIPLAEIAAATVEKETFTHRLVLTRRVAAGKVQKVKVNLRPLGKQADAFTSAFGRYWARDQAARKASAAPTA
ncbi:MAG TPA: M48 family metallopeptidase [Anaeromyxobacteraceae bacterium]|nr:M48 family metallopeptidase [Anaeromyxobacteraceae bacterium]